MDGVKLQELLDLSGNIRVLYVEDDKDARDAMLLILKNFFSHVAVAINGEEGLLKFNSDNFDLILTDINMPKMNGISMISQIRKTHKNIPIIVLSASNETDIFEKTKELEVNSYLLKPINMQQFIDELLKIAHMLNRANTSL